MPDKEENKKNIEYWESKVQQALKENDIGKAIARIKYNDISKPLACGDLTICNIEDLEIVINLVERQQKELEQLEAKKKAVINYLKEEISVMGRGKGMFLVKTALGAVLEKIEKGEKE